MAGVFNDQHAFRFDCDGTAGPFDFVCTRGWLVTDCMAAIDAAAAGATAQLQRSVAGANPPVFNNVTDAMAAAALNQITFAGQIQSAQMTFSAGDTMRIAVANTPQAQVIVETIPTTWVAG